MVGSPRAQINYTLNQPTDATRQAAQALLGEVLCLQSLSHPNIVRYLGVERDDISGVISIMLECAATHLPEYSTSRCGGRCTYPTPMDSILTRRAFSRRRGLYEG